MLITNILLLLLTSTPLRRPHPTVSLLLIAPAVNLKANMVFPHRRIRMVRTLDTNNMLNKLPCNPEDMVRDMVPLRQDSQELQMTVKGDLEQHCLWAGQ
jgi:hypothetical protein